ncbi:hypothetical protein [Brevundimonas sp.]|jgi:hypothetical protein|uniref:hypothetical protein n=1 Tax=Brevundimonas sp. TaxID=1871086 RepID=UPI0028AACCD8|nr:hypothetical protein [Brevundimonas sp.]
MSPKAILELGQALCRDLNGSLHDQILTRWLAHHLAETLAEASSAQGEAKVRAERNAVDLILRLWAERRSFPEDVDPLGDYRKAIDTLARLRPDANPWGYLRETPEGVLGQLYHALARTFVAGLLATSVSGDIKVLDGTMTEALSEEERKLRDLLDGWVAVLKSPRRRFPIVRASDEASTTDPEADEDAIEGEKTAEDLLTAALEEAVASAQTMLDRLKNREPSH